MNHKNILNEIAAYKMISAIMGMILALSQILLIVKGKLMTPEIKPLKKHLIKK